MKPWTQEGLHKSKGISLNSEEEKPDWYYQYSLVGVLVHTGNAESGHYYSYIKDRTQGPNHGKWFEYNDSNIYPFSLDRLADECFGGPKEVCSPIDFPAFFEMFPGYVLIFAFRLRCGTT